MKGAARSKLNALLPAAAHRKSCSVYVSWPRPATLVHRLSQKTWQGIGKQVTGLLRFFAGRHPFLMLRLSRKEIAGLVLARLLPQSQRAC
jgi:hypothetical protein